MMAVILFTVLLPLNAVSKLPTSLGCDYRLYVWLKNGEKLAYLLASHPKITHSDGMFHISGTDFVTDIPHSQIRKFTISNEAELVPVSDFNLIVWLKDGTKDYYQLAERPVAKFEDGTFHVVTNDKEMFYPASDVRKFTMEHGSEQILPGDANNDGVVNVNDIATIATFILNGHAEPWNEQNADANGDGTINVNDIAQTATIILNQAKAEIIH